MDLLFVIFALLFWFVKYEIDDYKSQKQKEIAESQRQLRDNIIDNIKAPYEIKNEIEIKVRNRDNLVWICDELNDELTDVLGHGYETRLKIFRTADPQLAFQDDGFWIIQMLLAKQGMVGSPEVYSGFYLGDGMYAEKNVKYCHHIERLLTKNAKFGNAYLTLYVRPKIYSVKEGYFYSIYMNSMDFFYNLFPYKDSDMMTKGRLWHDSS